MAGRPRGVGHAACLVLVECGPRELRAGLLDESFVVMGAGDVGFRRAHDDDVLHGLEVREDLLERGDQGGVHADHPVFRVVGDPGDLVGMQPDVQGVENRAHTGDGEVQLEVTRRVEGERTDPIPGSHAQLLQGIRQPSGPVPEFFVGFVLDPVRGLGGDPRLGIVGDRSFQQAGQDKRIALHQSAHEPS